MRSFILLWALIAFSPIHGQNCQKLDNVKFQSVKFGERVPPGLAACAKTGNGNYFIFDSLSTACKNKYADLFNKGSFNFLRIITNSNQKIYKVDVWTFLEPIDSAALANGKMPEKYTRLYNKLVNLYGKPKFTNDEYDMVTKKTRTVSWECNDIWMEMKVTYGSEKKDLNILLMEVKHKGFEMVEQERGQ